MTSTTRRIAPTLLAALACAGCQPASRADTTPPRPVASTAADAPRERPADTVILGEATYRERIKMPPGAALHVELLRLDGASPVVVASTRKPDVAGPPIPFSLPYEAARVDAAGRYGLRTELIGPDGERWMATAEPVPVVPGEGLAVEVLLHRNAQPAAHEKRTSLERAVHWECGEFGVESRYSSHSEMVALDFNGRRLQLSLARSASGARYADTQGNEFWTKGSTGRLTLAGDAARDCSVASQPSPWNAARVRGIAFRAVGNEPGWHVEVERGEAPALRATLDYGERTLSLPRTTPRGSGFQGDSSGEPVTLDIRRTPCTDGMSGQRFEATATLRVGSRAYEGCGAFLDD